MDLDAMFSRFLANCAEIWRMIITTHETETQKKAKEKSKYLLVLLGNIFFVAILLLAITWGMQFFYEKYSLFIKSFGSAFLKNAAAFLFIIVSFLLLVSLVVRVLLYLFTWVRMVDLFKYYVYIEIIILFFNFPGEQNTSRGPVVVKMFNKVFNTHFFEAKKTEAVTPSGIIIRGIPKS